MVNLELEPTEVDDEWDVDDEVRDESRMNAMRFHPYASFPLGYFCFYSKRSLTALTENTHIQGFKKYCEALM